MDPNSIDRLTSCMLTQVLTKILGGKWKPFIIWYLSLQPHQRARYGELKKIIPYKISDKMFSQHLNELEETGMLERVVVEDKPLWVDYLLTQTASAWQTSCISFAIGASRTVNFSGLRHSSKRRASSTMASSNTGTVGEDGKIDKTREHIVWYFDTACDEDEAEE